MLEQLPTIIFTIFSVAVVILLLVLAFKSRNSIMDFERGMMPIHKENCGGQFGSTNFSAPFVRLSIYNNFMVISYFKKILLNYHEIESIDLKGHLGMKTILINHKKMGIPKRIILQTKMPKKLKVLLIQN